MEHTKLIVTAAAKARLLKEMAELDFEAVAYFAPDMGVADETRVGIVRNVRPPTWFVDFCGTTEVPAELIQQIEGIKVCVPPQLNGRILDEKNGRLVVVPDDGI